MIRALILMLQIAVLAAIAAWLADHPGRVVIHLQDWWGQDWRIDTSVAVLIVLAGLIALAAALGYRAWRFAWGAPGQLVEARRSSRRRRGYRALSDGMVALATGNAAVAARLARRADALLKQPPATQVLSAQAAELGGDGGAARRHYEVLMEAPETAFIGLRGLLRQALEAGESAEALRLARRAYALKPSDEWVLNRLFDLQVGAAAWNAADATLAEALRRKAVPQADGYRQRAAVLVERGRAAEIEDDPAAAMGFMREANDLDPGLAPAAVAYARYLAEDGKTRRATRVLEQAWSTAPHPDIAAAYGTTGANGDPMQRVKNLERLLSLRSDEPEGHVALGEAALAARLWGEARNHLEQAAGAAPTARICRLMAELEEAEHGDKEVAASWLAKAAAAPADAGWVCGDCGAVAGGWGAKCGNCGAFAAMKWQPPPRVAALPPADDPMVALPAAASD